MGFQEKSYLITGGASGIGFSVAQQLTSAGANVILVSRQEMRLKEAIAKLNGRNNCYFPYDLSNIKDIGEVFSFLHTRGIILDGMVHCAGVSPLCLIKDNTPEQMESVFRVNVFSFIELVKYFQQENHSRVGAKIVAVSSITARGAGYRQTLYGASKAALTSAVKLMAKELLNRNIYVNTISPGVCDTPMLQELNRNADNLAEKIKASQPLGAIPPQKVGEGVLFLLSETSDFLTGTELIYDGGAFLK